MTLRFVVGPQRIERSRTDILLMIRHIIPFTTDSICVANDSVFSCCVAAAEVFKWVLRNTLIYRVICVVLYESRTIHM